MLKQITRQTAIELDTEFLMMFDAHTGQVEPCRCRARDGEVQWRSNNSWLGLGDFDNYTYYVLDEDALC